MQKSYLAKVTFDDNVVSDNGEKISLKWPDGSKFNLSVLDGPLNENNRLVEELLWRGVGRYGIGVEVVSEVTG